MYRSAVLMMALSGAVLGFFVAFSREPIAAAVVGGIISIATAVGLFFLQLKDGVATNARLTRTTSVAMVGFYAALIVSVIFFTLAAPWLPSNLDIKRDVIERFLARSGIDEISIGNKTYLLPAEGRTAAAALLLTSESLVDEADRFRTFGQGSGSTAPRTTSVGAAYCGKLAAAKETQPVDPAKLEQLDVTTSDRMPRLAARLLLAIDDPAKLYEAIARVEEAFCNPGSGESAR